MSQKQVTIRASIIPTHSRSSWKNRINLGSLSIRYQADQQVRDVQTVRVTAKVSVMIDNFRRLPRVLLSTLALDFPKERSRLVEHMCGCDNTFFLFTVLESLRGEHACAESKRNCKRRTKVRVIYDEWERINESGFQIIGQDGSTSCRGVEL